MDRPLAHSNAAEDVEKYAEDSVVCPRSESLEKRTILSEPSVVFPVPRPRRIAQWNTWIESLAGLEARGIARVPLEERMKHPP